MILLKKYLFFPISLLLTVSSVGQNLYNKYEITFANKKNSPFSLSNPSEYLSQKAIERREKQNISIDSSDLPVNPQYIDSIEISGVQVLCTSKWLNCVLIKAEDTINFSEISNFSFVKSIKMVYNHQFSQYRIKKTKNKFDNENAKSFDYGKATNQVEMIGADFLHKSGYEGKGITIAVIDAGFYNANNMAVFQPLFQNNQIIATWDFVDNESNVYNDFVHGTEVLSCLAAPSFGTAPQANYILLRSEDQNSETESEEIYWAAAAEYADSAGADIISSSLGYTTFDDSANSHNYSDMNGHSTQITQAAEMAVRKGILVVVSAGNDGNQPWHYIGAPADGDSVLAVGAVDKNRQVADFSSRGPTADGRIKPDVCAQGDQAAVYLPDNKVYYNNGTSFSAPIIAGACACLWQAFPHKTNMQIMRLVEENADHYNTPNNNIGYGIPSFEKAYLGLKGISIGNENLDHVIKMFPIPPTNQLNFYFFSSANQNLKVRLYNIAGKRLINEKFEVYQNSIKNISIPFTQYSSGTYILKLQTSNSSHTYKIPYVKN